jgi:hypothetical protein
MLSKAMAGRQTLMSVGMENPCALSQRLPCARITSIRFKGTVSVDTGKPVATPLAERWVTEITQQARL